MAEENNSGVEQQQQQQQVQQVQQVQLPQGAFMAEKYSEALPEDLRSHPFVQKNPNLEAAFRSAISAQQFIGKDPASLLEIPKPGDAAAFRGIMSRLGLPEQVDKYTVDDKSLPDNFKLGTPFGQSVIAAAHKHGILPQQFQGFYAEVAGTLNEAEKGMNTQNAAKKQEGYRAIQNEWGNAYDAKTNSAKYAIAKLGGEQAGDLMKELIDAGMDASPRVMNMLASVGEMLAEDGDQGASSPVGGFGSNSMTPAEAKAKGIELTSAADNEKDLTKRRALNDEAQKYFKIATGGR